MKNTPPDNANNDKQSIRQQMLERRNGLAASIIKDQSTLIQSHVIASDEFKSAITVGAYFAIGSEVRTGMIIGAAKEKGKMVALPRTEGEEIKFYEMSSIADLVPGKFGIKEPRPLIHVDKIDLILVPGVAFDKKGHRLGYGKGYYDRFLAETSAHLSFALAYSFQLMETDLPYNKFDRRLDAVVTENGISRTQE